MPSSLKRFPRPKMMTIKYGRGTLRAKVSGTYTRYMNGKKHTSHHITALDKLRKGDKERNHHRHVLHEHFTDTPKTRI